MSLLLLAGLLLLPIVFVIGSVVVWFFKTFIRGHYPLNVFETPQYKTINSDNSVSTAPLKEKKKKLVKNIITESAIKELNEKNDVDVIVIGSGIGGLSTASILSKAGKKVIVLEAHKAAGGNLHTFSRKNVGRGMDVEGKDVVTFPFEAGIHYLGDLSENSPLKVLLDKLCDKKLELDRLDENYDRIVVLDTKTGQVVKQMEMQAGRQNYENCLKREFPNEIQAIDKYLDILDKAKESSESYTVLVTFMKLLPVWLANLSKYLFASKYVHDVSTTMKSVVDSVTSNKTLQTCLLYFGGDYGIQPRDAPLYVHSTIQRHYMEGAYFPKHGASDIVESMTNVIKKSGGDVFTKAMVESIIIKNGKAVGVKLQNGSTINAPIIVSNAGQFNTFNKLIQEKDVLKYGLQPLQAYKPSAQLSCVFLGYEDNIEQLGLKYQNCWIATSDDMDGQRDRYMSCEGNLDPQNGVDIPFIFVSIKPQKKGSYITICYESNYEWFKDWEHQRVKKRSTDYYDLKSQHTDRVMEIFTKAFPQLANKHCSLSSSTPLTNQYYLNSRFGECYGNRMDKDRLLNMSIGRPQTPIEGLLMSGQDILSLGVVGAMVSSLLTSSVILHRSIFTDWFSVASSEKSAKKAQ